MGLGARELLRDTSVYPVRGVLLHTPLLPLPNGWGGIIDVEGGNDGVNSYIFQRTNSLVIGGTAFENDFTVAQDKNVDDDIVSAIVLLSMLIPHMNSQHCGRCAEPNNGFFKTFNGSLIP